MVRKASVYPKCFSVMKLENCCTDSGNARRPHRKVKYEGIEVLRVLLAKSKEHGVLVPG